MALAALLALSLLASEPAADPTPATVAISGDNNAVAASGDGDQDIPPGAPTDDYGFVAWCYGAMDESILVYEKVLPELKAIDQRIGSPVKEAVPYAQDVAEEKVALKRFSSALEAAERASPQPIAERGASDIALGRSIWSQARLQPPRQLAHAWLMWGSPDRCETTAKTLKANATLLGQAMAVDAPSVDGPAPAPAASAEAPAPQPANAAPKASDSIDSLLGSGGGANGAPAQPPK